MDKYISYNYNNNPFEYSNEGVKTTPAFLTPKMLYKYYSFSEHNINALKDNCLYASHSYLLNDSCDSSDRIFDFKDIAPAFYRGFHKTILGEKYIDAEIFEDYKKDKLEGFRGFRETFVSSLSNRFGNISFTENRRNSLMWSHYSQEKGFCIEFETDLLIDYEQVNSDIKEIFFRPMQYVEKIKLLNISTENFQGITVPFLYLTTVKDKQWEYEREYRLTILKKDMDIPFNKKYKDIKYHKGVNDRFFRYDKRAIKSIILGQNFFLNDFIKILDNGVFEIEISEKSEHIADFVNLLYEKYKDRVFMVGETQENGFLEKGITQIFFDRIRLNHFKISSGAKYLL